VAMGSGSISSSMRFPGRRSPGKSTRLRRPTSRPARSGSP
jgi:hypothetical protein